MTPNPTSTTPPPGSEGTRVGRREWTALGVLMLPLLLVSMDVSVLYFAIPSISADLEPSGTQQLWIFDIYGFVLAGLLMTMGSLGDRVGRRRLLLIGAVAFGAASLVAAYAHSAETLIAARAILGIGGATLMPTTMALVRTMFTDPGQRAKAIGLWSGVMTAGIALGSVMRGFGGDIREAAPAGAASRISPPKPTGLLLGGVCRLASTQSDGRRGHRLVVCRDP